MNNKRAVYLLVIFSFMFLTLIGYITYLEIFYADEYTKSAYNPRYYELDRTVIRGSIYDRNGVELAYSEKISEEVTETVDGKDVHKTIEKIVRRYPFDNLYAHVIGYVSPDYSSRTLVENKFNSELLESDAFSKIADQLKTGEKRGSDIYLTIDHELQQYAYEAMGNHKGAVVVMNPKNGEILAMVSKPDFNPNYDKLSLDTLEDTALFSRAIQMPYPPGSTYKIVTSACAIENGFEDEVYNDNNGVYVIESSDGNDANSYKCQNVNKYAYGSTNLQKGFQVSSNVYFSYLGDILGTSPIQNTAKKFLLGKDIGKTLGFELPIAKSSFQSGNMTRAERAMSSIGQGKTEMTPMHMALVASAVANDGVMPCAHMVTAIGKSDVSNGGEGQRVMKSSTAQQLKEMMLSVVESGTGTAARVNGIKVCGKTGTSENSVTAKGGADSSKTHALFVGFAPYDDPEIAICVVLEHAGFGGSVAAPVAGKIMTNYFEN
ncbi:MAG: peptidoglycan glycosyltransferase [Ruminococcaceae bacterium]|nr:peptidoglycan glycosyltransferase [Oscillospiraceae bacterium]